MDSGTKSKRILRLLSVLLLAVLLVSVSAVAVLADSEEGPPAEDVTEVSQGTETEGESSGTYVSVFASGYENLPEDASMMERLMYGLQVAGIGILVVFLVLIIIMAILYIFKLVAVSKSKKAAPAVPAPAAAAPVAAAPKAAAPSASGSEEETIVAIATAAIAASRGASDCAFKVISVTKIQ